jgi:hypothetical protein
MAARVLRRSVITLAAGSSTFAHMRVPTGRSVEAVWKSTRQLQSKEVAADTQDPLTARRRHPGEAMYFEFVCLCELLRLPTATTKV